VIFTMIFAPAEQAFAAARNLHRLHQTITGTLPESTGRFGKGTAYLANEVSALRWVHATLVDSAMLAYDLLLPSLSEVEREEYVSQSRRMAALFGLSPEDLPQTVTEFSEYMQTTLGSEELGVSPATRGFAQRLQSGAGLLAPPPFWYRALTIELLPQRLRQEFQFAYDDRTKRASARAVSWLRRLYPRLPETLRFVGPYNEARKRLSGRDPGMMVRFCNRLWIGQPALVTVSTIPRLQAFSTNSFSPPSASHHDNTES
jgi:uncharacterized protein (DUF2236 family)